MYVYSPLHAATGGESHECMKFITMVLIVTIITVVIMVTVFIIVTMVL